MAQDEVIDNWWETEQDLLEDVADELSSSSTDESLPVNAAEKKPVGPKKHPKDASIAREKSSNDNSSQSDDENGDNATVSVEKTEEVKKAPAKPRKRTPPLDAWRLVGHAKGFKLLRRLAASLHESFATEHSPASNAVSAPKTSTRAFYLHFTETSFRCRNWRGCCRRSTCGVI